ncbi:unnamed protein product [Nesidiocoris tenuis]|uniref:Uncharacterized protein n=1 Tax=Nesidiocoris tenuis TaxID=355587 RepID=A0A6H5H6M5_9HEMI|nr:unnamed protein product [Nesidiocoris tenuis]
MAMRTTAVSNSTIERIAVKGGRENRNKLFHQAHPPAIVMVIRGNQLIPCQDGDEGSPAVNEMNGKPRTLAKQPGYLGIFSSRRRRMGMGKRRKTRRSGKKRRSGKMRRFGKKRRKIRRRSRRGEEDETEDET